MSEVTDFYDEFTIEQQKAGINNRHLSIRDHLREVGLKTNHRVLEIGCGIGTVSELILRYLSNEGYLHSVDISPKSIELAKARLKKYQNAKIEVRDLANEPVDDLFDVIVLPDVVEHIPLAIHNSLFTNVFRMLRSNGFVFIHIPHPNNLEWMVDNKHEGLQIIDQPIFTNELCATVYPIGFYIHYLKSYSIYCVDHDYQIVILKKKPATQNLNNLDSFYLPSLLQRVLYKLKYLARGFK